MKQIHLGVFCLGHANVDLYALPDEIGGVFYSAPDRKSLPRIKVGLDSNDWNDCVAWLLHEAMELSLCSQNLRYAHSGKLNGDSSDFIFHFDHSQFGRTCSEVAMFMSGCLPTLADAYNKNKKKKK